MQHAAMHNCNRRVVHKCVRDKMPALQSARAPSTHRSTIVLDIVYMMKFNANKVDCVQANAVC